MARQQDVCWHCGTRWETGDEPRVRLQVIHGGAATPVAVSVAEGA
jgi:hypothetical protein